MIARMNKQQRQCIIDLIEEMINCKVNGSSIDHTHRLVAEELFHEAFKNEDESEDNHNHVG